MTTDWRFTAAELAGMQEVQDGHMMDKCIILSYGETVNAYGNPTPNWTEGAEMWCGFQHVTPREVQPSGNVPDYDARLRLPIDTVIDPRDHVRITERHGEDITAERYQVIGSPRRGPSGLYLNMKLVTDGRS